MRRTIVGLLATLLLASLLTPWALGLAVGHEENSGSSDDDPMGDEFEDEFDEPRSLEIEEESGEVELESTGPDGDRIRVRLDAEDAEVRFDMIAPGTNATEVQLELEFESLQEYVDVDDDGQLTAADDVVQEVRVDDMAFAPPQWEVLEDGLRLELAYQAGNLTFGVVFWAFGNETVLNGTLVRPSEVKFDILVDGFPFDREDSRLAVLLDLKTETEPIHETNATAEFLEVVASDFEAFFGWANTAEVDGQTVPVNATVLEVETETEDNEFEVERAVALSYPQGETILHDPVLGISSRSPGAGTGTVALLAYGGMAAAAALVVLLLVTLRRRR